MNSVRNTARTQANKYTGGRVILLDNEEDEAEEKTHTFRALSIPICSTSSVVSGKPAVSATIRLGAHRYLQDIACRAW